MQSLVANYLLLLRGYMTDIEIQKEIIQNKLGCLSNLEKSEFYRRFKLVYNSKASKIKLIEKQNAILQLSQSELKERGKQEVQFGLICIATILIHYFFPIFGGDQIYVYAVLLAIMFAAWTVKNSISDSKLLILKEAVQFEIDRYANEINQYGIFLVSESDLFFEYDNMREPFRGKFSERAEKARVELQIEILNYMGQEIDAGSNNPQ